MRKLKLMHIADLHLGAPCYSFGRWADDRKSARDLLFGKLIDAACSDADMLIISGDLFDRHDPEATIVSQVKAGLRRFASGGGITILVPGNHDEITYPKSVYRREAWEGICTLVASPRPAIVFSAPVKGEHVTVMSCAYTGGVTKKQDMEALPAVPEGSFGIAALHASLNAAPPGKDMDRAMIVKSSAISAAGYKYAALGHFHKKAHIVEGGALFVYPGIIEAAGYSDEPVSSWVLVEICGGRAEARWIPLPGSEGFRRVKLNISGSSPADAAKAILEAAGDSMYVDAELSGTVSESFQLEEVLAELEASGKRARIKADELGADDQELSVTAGEMSIRGLFVKELLAEMEGAPPQRRKVLEMAVRLGLDALRRNA